MFPNGDVCPSLKFLSNINDHRKVGSSPVAVTQSRNGWKNRLIIVVFRAHLIRSTYCRFSPSAGDAMEVSPGGRTLVLSPPLPSEMRRSSVKGPLVKPWGPYHIVREWCTRYCPYAWPLEIWGPAVYFHCTIFNLLVSVDQLPYRPWKEVLKDQRRFL